MEVYKFPNDFPIGGPLLLLTANVSMSHSENDILKKLFILLPDRFLATIRGRRPLYLE